MKRELLDSEVCLNLNLDVASKRMFAKRPTQVADISFAHLDLHVQNPPVAYLSWSAADLVIDLAATEADARIWADATAVYRHEAAARQLYEHRVSEPELPREALLFGNDLQLLIDSEFAVDTGLSQEAFERSNKFAFYVRLFSVVEERNGTQRRRVIAWPENLNEDERLHKQRLSELHFRPRFYTAREIRDTGTCYKYAASLDFKKFFQQFELLTKNFWCFVYRGRVFRLSTIPTGAVFPPLLAQALSRTLLSLSVRKANVTQYVKHDCCIDNLRLASDNLHALWAAWHELLEICSFVGATIGEQQPPPTSALSPYTYLGMKFFVVDELSHVELSDKSKRKLASAISLLNSREPLLVADALALFGQTVWATTVTGFSLGKLYYVIKFIRRIQTQPLHAYVHVWPSIIALWTDALTVMTTLIYQRAANPSTSATMYTDASESGWGIVIVDYAPRPIRIFGGRWSSSEAKLHINTLELRAVRIGLRILSQLKSPFESIALQLFVDNTTARAWTRRGRAKQWQANQLAVHLCEHASSNGIQLASVDYVRSHQNLADGPSRSEKAGQLRPAPCGHEDWVMEAACCAKRAES